MLLQSVSQCRQPPRRDHIIRITKQKDIPFRGSGSDITGIRRSLLVRGLYETELWHLLLILADHGRGVVRRLIIDRHNLPAAVKFLLLQRLELVAQGSRSVVHRNNDADQLTPPWTCRCHVHLLHTFGHNHITLSSF